MNISEFLNIESQETAAIIIDMEKSFVDPEGAHCIKGAAKTVPECNRILEACRKCNIPVFFVKRIYRNDGSDVEFTRFDSWDKGGRGMAPNSEGSNSIEEPDGLKRYPQDYVIIKPRWSAFFQTELDLILRRKHIKNIILLGTTTPNCIRTTCYDAIAMDYETYIIEQCCSSNTEEIQQSNMDDMERIGAHIIRDIPMLD